MYPTIIVTNFILPLVFLVCYTPLRIKFVMSEQRNKLIFPNFPLRKIFFKLKFSVPIRLNRCTVLSADFVMLIFS